MSGATSRGGPSVTRFRDAWEVDRSGVRHRRPLRGRDPGRGGEHDRHQHHPGCRRRAERALRSSAPCPRAGTCSVPHPRWPPPTRWWIGRRSTRRAPGRGPALTVGSVSCDGGCPTIRGTEQPLPAPLDGRIVRAGRFVWATVFNAESPGGDAANFVAAAGPDERAGHCRRARGDRERVRRDRRYRSIRPARRRTRSREQSRRALGHPVRRGAHHPVAGRRGRCDRRVDLRRGPQRTSCPALLVAAGEVDERAAATSGDAREEPAEPGAGRGRPADDGGRRCAPIERRAKVHCRHPSGRRPTPAGRRSGPNWQSCRPRRSSPEPTASVTPMSSTGTPTACAGSSPGRAPTPVRTSSTTGSRPPIMATCRSPRPCSTPANRCPTTSSAVRSSRWDCGWVNCRRRRSRSGSPRPPPHA